VHARVMTTEIEMVGTTEMTMIASRCPRTSPNTITNEAPTTSARTTTSDRWLPSLSEAFATRRIAACTYVPMKSRLPAMQHCG